MAANKDLRKFVSEIVKKEFNKINEEIEGIGTLVFTQEKINKILKGYLECALWTEEENLKEIYQDDEKVYDDEEDEEENEIDKIIRLNNNLSNKQFNDFIVDDLDSDSKIQAYLDIKTFLKNAGKDAVEEAIEENGEFKLGMDIWFTRNGHGAGFFDHSYDHEDELIKAGNTLSQVDLYVTDDNKLAFSNAY